MHFALLVIVAQLHSATIAPQAHQATRAATADSARDLSRARSAQASFERTRRNSLPISHGGGGRCDVRLGRYCWWYDATNPTLPPEADVITHRRAELVSELDALGKRYPGDDWLAGMRVYYRVDGRNFDGADSVARSCHATDWWCSALVGYAAHVRGEAVRADSAFAAANAAMPADVACAWRDITTLLGDGDRDMYEHRTCEARREMETRYWLISRPQLASGANEWQNEFNTRRVLVRIAERAATPYALSWGDDEAELVLRYGWPAAWSKVETSSSSMYSTEPSIIGHDPSPSFTFALKVKLGDSLSAIPADAWDPDVPHGESRYAPRLIKRVADVTAQFARFRRGDSTLVVAAFVAADDSLRSPVATLAAMRVDGASAVSTPDTVRVGTSRVAVSGEPLLAGMELHDTMTHTLARVRVGFVPVADTGRLHLSDLLVYRAGSEPASTLDSALVRAIPGDTVTRGRPIGLFWETYGLSEGETVDVAVSLERVDHSWIRSTRQRLGLTPVDTPLRIKWTDSRSAGSTREAGHAISLDLENLDAGRYRLTLTLTPFEGTPVNSVREIDLRNP